MTDILCCSAANARGARYLRKQGIGNPLCSVLVTKRGRHPISSAYFWYFASPLGGMLEYFSNPDFVTEVELTFTPIAGGGTRVTLQHRDLERFGADAAGHAEKLGGGWPIFLGHFADHVASHG